MRPAHLEGQIRQTQSNLADEPTLQAEPERQREEEEERGRDGGRKELRRGEPLPHPAPGSPARTWAGK